MKNKRTLLLILGMVIILGCTAVNAFIAPLPGVIRIPALAVGAGLLIAGRIFSGRK